MMIDGQEISEQGVALTITNCGSIGIATILCSLRSAPGMGTWM
jgi:hypothetical protein